MAFDEKGQADTLERKIEICERGYRILVDEVGFPPEDIIFDPNIFAIATGIEEHNNYGVDFIEATRWIHREPAARARPRAACPNVSFSFRGNNPVREAIHTAFLYHAIKAGLTMGIVNAGQLGVYDEIPQGPARARRGHHLQPPPRCDRAHGGVRRDGEGRGKKDAVEDLAWRKGTRRGAPHARAGERHHRLHRRGHRGGAPASTGARST